MIFIRHVICKDDTKVDLKKVEAVFISYVKGFRDEKYKRFDDLQTSRYHGL